jgi:hypothetical protein
MTSDDSDAGRQFAALRQLWVHVRFVGVLDCVWLAELREAELRVRGPGSPWARAAVTTAAEVQLAGVPLPMW